jgi:hypothetical protein
LAEIVLRGTLVYLALFFMLRFDGKRTAGAIGITDLLVVVVIADAVQNAMASEHKTVLDGLLLAATILFWDYALDCLGYRSPRFRRLLRAPPLPLVRDGQMLRRNMRQELVTVDELLSLLREQGVEDVAAPLYPPRCVLRSRSKSIADGRGRRVPEPQVPESPAMIWPLGAIRKQPAAATGALPIGAPPRSTPSRRWSDSRRETIPHRRTNRHPAIRPRPTLKRRRMLRRRARLRYGSTPTAAFIIFRARATLGGRRKAPT